MKSFTRRLELLLLIARVYRVTADSAAELTGLPVQLLSRDLNLLAAQGWIEKSTGRTGQPYCLRSIYYLADKSVKLRSFSHT